MFLFVGSLTLCIYSLSNFINLETLACASNPCQNGATCFDNNGGGGGYACLCPVGFEGTNCENGIYSLTFSSFFSSSPLCKMFSLFSWHVMRFIHYYAIYASCLHSGIFIYLYICSRSLLNMLLALREHTKKIVLTFCLLFDML